MRILDIEISDQDFERLGLKKEKFSFQNCWKLSVKKFSERIWIPALLWRINTISLYDSLKILQKKFGLSEMNKKIDRKNPLLITCSFSKNRSFSQVLINPFP